MPRLSENPAASCFGDEVNGMLYPGCHEIEQLANDEQGDFMPRLPENPTALCLVEKLSGMSYPGCHEIKQHPAVAQT